MAPRSSSRLTSVDLFAGAGGLSLGLAQAGFETIAAVERDPQAAMTYELNHGVKPLVKDAATVTGKDLVPDGRRRVSLIAAGPPCQGFSMKGQRRADHPGNAMLNETVRLVTELRPRAVLIENVVGLTSMLGGYYFDRLITSLERVDLGDGRRYEVDFAVLNAGEFEAPQNRKRLFIVAVEPECTWSWPVPTSKLGDITLWDAIGDLPGRAMKPGELAVYGKSKKVSTYARALREGSTVVHNHHTKNLQETRKLRLRALEEGQDRRDLPEELAAGGHESKYRRLRANAPCPTVTAHMGKDLSDFIHPKLNRTLTAREAARVQGYPDSFEFLGSQAAQLTQIGNSVPVPLARALGISVATALRARGRGVDRRPGSREDPAE